MENLKYALTRQQCESDSTYFRIVALRSFKLIDGVTINAGDFGGMIQRPENLSQEGSCWIDFNSVVCDNAVVDGDAVVIESTISDGAIVTDSAFISNSDIQDFVIIKNNVTVKNSTITDTVRIENNSEIVNSYISGSLVIKENSSCVNSYLENMTGILYEHTSINDSDMSGTINLSSSSCLNSCTIDSAIIIADPITLNHVQLKTKGVTLNIEYSTDLITVPTWWDPDTDFITYIPKLKRWNFEDELVDSETLINLAKEHYSSFVVEQYKKLIALTCGD